MAWVDFRDYFCLHLKHRFLVLLYNISIRLYFLAIRFAAFWNKKAKEWIDGRRTVFEDLEQTISRTDRIIWMHCSSAGEFEQGKPVIEQLKKEFPSHKILISFFSPSGFGVAANYKNADVITYLPLDTRRNSKRFIRLVNPELAIFIKYEFWYHHLSAAAFGHVPLLLVSAVFRKEQGFFKWYGKFYKQMLFLFRHIFVQDKASLELLQQAAIPHCSISGDTRFDRVKEIGHNFSEIPFISQFINQEKVIVAGSTWGEDEELLSQLQESKIIIAPHEINEAHLAQIENLFPSSIRYSRLQAATGKELVLIIDNIGMLSKLYYYATIAYVGGGFTKDGIHNILEAAVYGKPVLFGPNYHKYREATELIASGAAFSVRDAIALKKRVALLWNNEQQLQTTGANAKNYVEQNLGATQKIMQFIQEKRLLTR